MKDTWLKRMAAVKTVEEMQSIVAEAERNGTGMTDEEIAEVSAFYRKRMLELFRSPPDEPTG